MSLRLFSSTTFLCSVQVYATAKKLSEWEKQVAQLRTQYEQLLYFTIPKLLHLYHMITSQEPDIDGIVQEVGFLFQNKPVVRQKLRGSVKVYTHLDVLTSMHVCRWSFSEEALYHVLRDLL